MVQYTFPTFLSNILLNSKSGYMRLHPRPSPYIRLVSIFVGALVSVGLIYYGFTAAVAWYKWQARYAGCELVPEHVNFWHQHYECRVWEPVENRPPAGGTELMEALVNNPVPVATDCHPLRQSDEQPLVLVALFSVASKIVERDMHRLYGRLGIRPEHKKFVEFAFVIGKSRSEEENKMVAKEREVYGDIILLDEIENMDDGKTYFFFRWLAKKWKSGGTKPRFVVKADDDTFLVLPNVLETLTVQNCSDLVYWGTSLGSCLDNCYPFYMQGMAYGLSWQLIEWIGTANLTTEEYSGTEDAKTGQYILSLPHGGEEVVKLELGKRLGSHDEMRVPQDIDTVGLHYLKDPLVWIDYAHKMFDIWRQSEREYAWTGPQS